MAPSRRQVSGRSPLVNPQRQITSFFGKSASSPSPSPSNHKTPKSYNPNSPSPLSNTKTPKSNPNPNSPPLSDNKAPKSNSPARSPSPGPTTPSPVHPKLKKPLLVIGQTPSPPKFTETATYGDEVVGKGVRVYWPLDKKWYDGSVTSYDKGEGKHMVEYEDGEEESLDLGKEKIEWVVVGEESVKRFKRLRRGASSFRRVVLDDEEDVEMGNVEDEKEDKSDGDDSSDEDWGKNVGKEEVCESEEDAEDEEEMVVEEDEESPSKADSKKRKKSSEVAKPGGEKKIRTGKDTTLKGFKASVVEPVKKSGEGNWNLLLL